MKSKANINTHPLHPMLVTLPIGFFTGTLLFDIIGNICKHPPFWQTGYYLEISGIVAGLLAAVPGIIDYLHTIPPHSSAKKRGAQHGLLNVSMLILFTIAFILRSNENIEQLYIIIIESIAFALLALSGWLGGTLVFRNQIGVYNRYAAAGNWNEEKISQSAGKILVATTDELKTDQMKILYFADKRIAISRADDGFYAFDDRCSHKGGSLAGGTMICGTVQCPWHGSQFDVRTGNVKAGPAKEKINTYTTSVENGKIFLHL